MKTHAVFSWARIEYLFLAVFLILRLFHFFATYGTFVGYDVGAQIPQLGSMSFTSFSPDIRSGLYAYHPPLGFLIMLVFHQMGFGLGQSIQITTALASLVAFFFLRAIMSALGHLRRPLGIAFLYITSSLPFQISLSSSINLDALLLAFTTITLYLSVRLFWLPQRSKVSSWILGVLLVFAMLAGLFIKFSGLFLFAIPIFVTCLTRSWKAIGVAAIICAAGILIAFPYYYERYYTVSGHFFPGNVDLLSGWQQKVAADRTARDADKLTYIENMFLPDSAEKARDPGYRDYSVMRFDDTWRDVWAGDTVRIPMSDATKNVASAYLFMMPWLVLVGFAGWIVSMLRQRLASDRLWHKFGIALMLIGIVQCGALLYYMYKYPIPDWRYGKAIYIAPVALSIGWLLAHVGAFFPPVFKRLQYADMDGDGVVLLILTALFLVINTLLPVY